MISAHGHAAIRVKLTCAWCSIQNESNSQAIVRMRTEFRKAIVAKQIRSLIEFDRKAFEEYPADWFDAATWRTCEPWWMLVNNKRIGCCAFISNVDFKEDIRDDRSNASESGTLYIVSTGILPSFRSLGFGTLMKSWQLCYARRHGFSRIVTNTRKSNKPMIGLNKKFGFRVVRTTSDYYENPPEPTLVMELKL